MTFANSLKVRAQSVEMHLSTRPSTGKQTTDEMLRAGWNKDFHLFFLLLLILRGN